MGHYLSDYSGVAIYVYLFIIRDRIHAKCQSIYSYTPPLHDARITS